MQLAHRSILPYLKEDPNNPAQKLQTWWISYYVAGKRKRESSKSRKKSDAQALLKRRMGEHALGLEIGDEEKRLTFEDLMGRNLLLAGRPEEALGTLRQVEDPPPHVRAATARALVALGRREEARRVLHELEQEAARRYVRPEAIAEVYVALGEPDAAFRWLETAYQARSTGVLQLKVEQYWDPIRSDPRFAALVKKVGIP